MKNPPLSRLRAAPTAVLRIATAASLAALAIGPAPALSQDVGPPVVEYRERGIGVFEVRNNTLFPMNVVMEPFGFVQDSLGKISYIPFDTAAIKLRLSTMSLRLPPRSALTVSYEVSSAALPAWFVITSTFAGIRRQGVNYNFQLPHVVYLNQKTAVRKDSVLLSVIALDTTAKQVRFRLRNTSHGLTRCREGTLSAVGTRSAKTSIVAFPLFPGFERLMKVDWTHAVLPTKLHLSCTGVDLDFDRLTVATTGSAVGATSAR